MWDPQNGGLIVEYPIKMDNLGVSSLQETSLYAQSGAPVGP